MQDIVYNYSSTQIYLDDLADKIIDWGQKHIPNKDIYTNPEDPSFGRENEIHLTLLYGIHADNPKQVKELLKEQKPFTCTLGKISLFKTNPKFDVVKIDVKGREIHKLHKLLSNNLEVTNSYPVYVPHITIAYVKPNKANHLIGNRTFEGKKFNVTEIIFSSKNGKKITLSIN